MILFADSASYCDNPGFNNGKYAITIIGTPLQYQINAGRYAGFSMTPYNTGFGSWAGKKSILPSNVVRVHVSFTPHNIITPTGDFPNCVFGGLETPGTKLLTWKINNSAKQITFYTGGAGTNSSPGTLLATSIATFPFDTWHTIEIEATFGPGGILSFYVDDVLDFTLTGITWASSSNPTVFTHYWESLGFAAIQWCDVVVSDNQGTVNNARLGPCQVLPAFPLLDAIVPQWNRNQESSDAAAVNEQNPNPHGAPNFDYNYIDGPDGALDLFTIAAPPCFGRNLALAANACAKNGTIELVCRPLSSSSVVHDVGTSISPGAAYAIVQQIQELSYRTGTWWTDKELGAAWWGVRALGGPRVTQFFVEKVTSLRAVPFKCGGIGSYVV